MVASTDAERFRSFYEADWRAGLDADQLAAADAAHAVVIDPDAPETTCPACLTTVAVAVAGATSAGGLAALTVKAFRRRAPARPAASDGPGRTARRLRASLRIHAFETTAISKEH